MRLTGRGILGEPTDRDECLAVVRRAVELGVQFIDTADYYGPFVAEQIIRDAVHPDREDVVIATKAGLTATAPTSSTPVRARRVSVRRGGRRSAGRSIYVSRR